MSIQASASPPPQRSPLSNHAAIAPTYTALRGLRGAAPGAAPRQQPGLDTVRHEDDLGRRMQRLGITQQWLRHRPDFREPAAAQRGFDLARHYRMQIPGKPPGPVVQPADVHARPDVWQQQQIRSHVRQAQVIVRVPQTLRQPLAICSQLPCMPQKPAMGGKGRAHAPLHQSRGQSTCLLPAPCAAQTRVALPPDEVHRR